MGRLIKSFLLVLGVSSFSQAITYQAVRASTANITTPTIQTGTMNLSSGTITNFSASTVTASAFVGPVILNRSTLQSGATFFVSSGTVSGTLTAGTFSGSASGLTSVPGTQVTGVIPAASLTNAIVLQATLQTGATFFVSSGTANNFNSTTMIVTTITPTGIVGTTTNNNASVGNYGETKTTASIVSVNATGNDVYDDLLFLSLTAGDWMCSGQILWSKTGGGTWSGAYIGISQTSGNSSTGLVDGDTEMFGSWGSSAVTPFGVPFWLTNVRESLSATTIVYLKRRATYSGGTPQTSGGRLTCVRIR